MEQKQAIKRYPLLKRKKTKQNQTSPKYKSKTVKKGNRASDSSGSSPEGKN